MTRQYVQTRIVRWVFALLGVVLASSISVNAAAPPGMAMPPHDSVGFGRLSACVADPKATGAFLSRVLGWRAMPSVQTAKQQRSASSLVVTDVRGFQLQLSRAADCGDVPYKQLSFVAKDVESVLGRLRKFSPAPAGVRELRSPGSTPLIVPKDVTAGTSVTVESASQHPASSVRGTGTVRVDRIAIFVADLERSARFYTDVLGLRRNPEIIELEGAENARSGGLNVSFIDANGVWLALVQPVGAGPLRDYLVEHGDGHIAELIVEVDDLSAFYDRMVASGIALVDTRGEPVDPQVKAHVLWPYGDRIAYFPAAVAGGLVIELAQRGPPATSLLERRDRAGEKLRNAH